MPRVGLTAEAVVDAAMALLDRHGTEPTLAAVAAHTGVAPPSLYKHVRSVGDVRRLIAVRVIDELADRLGGAVMGRGGAEALTALMNAWRDYVRQYPHRYALLPLSPLTDPLLLASAARLMEVVMAVLRGFGLDGSDAIHAARRLRASVHGFVMLEAQGGFGLPEDVDESYRRLVVMVTRDLEPAAYG